MSDLERTESSLVDVQRRFPVRIPWYYRTEVLLGSLVGVVLVVVFLLPQPGALSAADQAAIGVCYILALAWGALLFSDPGKPEWAKMVTAFALLFLGGWLFYRYADAQWNRLNHVFFNWRLMREPAEGGESAWLVLFRGLGVTVQIAVFSALLGTLLGLLLAVFRAFNNRVLNLFIVAYIDFFRSMPIIVLMVLIYYALPYTGITLSAVASGILALGLNSSAYISEIFRAGILAVHHGQIEAAHALGLDSWKTMRLIVLPQAFRVVIPPLASNYVASAKDTAICSAISILELLKSAMQVQAFRANPTPLIAATVLYILLFVPLTRLAGMLESRMRVRRARG
ncbi:MAG: amino acid ABC transporter permease [Anaerolineae bacterium]